MASPQPDRRFFSPSSDSRAPKTPLSDEAIWRRLRDAGFDEDSIKRRDKAALIAYIAKLEAEIFDHQHQMGLLLLERKEWTSRYEQIKASAESAELMYKHEQAAHSCALTEAKKQEDSLKKALEVEKECLKNIEKALHEIRAESAETKVSADIKLNEARSMVENAENKFSEAEAKLQAADSLQAEASRFHQDAERKMKEVEAREDDLRRRIVAFKSNCDAKEKEMILERQSLSERQKILQQGQERLLEEKASLNRREEYIFSRSQEIDRLGKELEASKTNIEKESMVLIEEKSNLELKVASLSAREEAIIEKEALLNRNERDLLNLQEELASKKASEIKNLLANHETKLKLKQSEFEAELQRKCQVVEDEIEMKRRAWELREVDLSHKEDLMLEREHDLEVHSQNLACREKDVTEKFNLLEEKEKNLIASEKEIEYQKIFLQKEKKEINSMKQDLQKSLDSLENKKKQVDSAEEKLEVMKNETNELMLLEMKLKEEIDVVRAQKHEIEAEADKLQAEKAKFEIEWELIDEKREHLRREAERVAEERRTISNVLKDERDNLKLEKDAIRDQYKRDIEAFRVEREAFASEMEHERSEWFQKIQQERADLLLDIEMQKRELENCFDKRSEEIESYLKDRERTFEQERNSELQNINYLKEMVAKDSEHIAFEMKRLESERVEISQDRELRAKEWSDLGNSIEELKMQQKKLEEQRELLHADREKVHAQIEYLEKLENLKVLSDNIAAAEMQKAKLRSSRRKVYAKRSVRQKTLQVSGLDSHKNVEINDGIMHLPSKQKIDGASPSATPFVWLKRCADLIFKPSPEKSPLSNGGRPLESDDDDSDCAMAGQLESSYGFQGKLLDENVEKGKAEINEWMRVAVHEPKVILEVPPCIEEAKGIHNIDSGPKADASDSSAHSLSEQGFLAGKRRVESTFSTERIATPLEQKQNNRKRRQQEDISQNRLEEITAEGDTQPNVLHDQVSASFNHMQGVAEETIICVEKAADIADVTYGNTDNPEDQAKAHHDSEICNGLRTACSS